MLTEQESVCGYRLNSYFIFKSGQTESQAGLTSFFAVGVFVDDTIWIGSSQAATQYILNVASKFFSYNDIFINNNKTVAIPINCWVSNPYLTVSGLPIFVTKKEESYCYLDIFLSSKGFLKLSLTESKLTSLVFFVNSLGILVQVRINSSNSFLAGMVCIFSGCDLSLGGFLTSIFHFWDGTSMSLVFDKHDYFKYVSFLWCYGVAFVDQLYDKHDRSLNSLRTSGIIAGAVVFFEDIDLGISVRVSGLVFFIIAELQAIALALKCIPSSCSVNLFLNSQTALNACKSKSVLAYPDFRNQYWVKCCHIFDVIHHKNLDVNWVKVKEHSEVSNNKYADVLTRAAAFSDWHLLHMIKKCFLRAGGIIVSGGLIQYDSSMPVLVSGLPVVLLAGVVRLLGVADVFGISFEFYKSCLFFLNTGDIVSVHIDV
ncbi:hypothetical protein G9A89_020152 [Geosiphon pyriformis]|nr:hypothetical protein G9A89_020152 [Geosiphon pyriformis]